jgi:hypothetical protein
LQRSRGLGNPGKQVQPPFRGSFFYILLRKALYLFQFSLDFNVNVHLPPSSGDEKNIEN